MDNSPKNIFKENIFLITSNGNINTLKKSF